jgi:hypothetical protein
MADLLDVYTEVAAQENLEPVTEVEETEATIDNPDDGTDEVTDVEEVGEETDPVEAADTPDGEPEADDGDVEAPEETSGLSWDEIAERYGDVEVPLTVNGETVYKKLSELPSNAMMREDYSRKTAEISQAAKAAEWAYEVRDAFARDPEGTIAAFEKAYNIQRAPQQPESDPYEDYDPDIAAVMKRLDEQNAALRQELDSIKQFQGRQQEDSFRAEVEAELAATMQEFEGEFEEVELLKFATERKMTLPDAAEVLWARNQRQRTAAEAEAATKAREAAATRKTQKRKQAKDTVKAAPKGGYDVEPSTDDFNNISELFDIVMNSSE